MIARSLLLIFCMTLLGCGPLPGRPKPGPEVPRPEEVVDFSTLYRENCSGCHGAEGRNGPSYPLSNPVYQALVDEPGLLQVIAHGEPGTLMPAFASSAGGNLTDQQVEVLVKGMRGAWYQPGALAGAHPPPYRATRAGDAGRGRVAYATYCSSCHGTEDEKGKAVKSKAGSITDTAFLSLVSDQVLRTVIIAGRPDIGQPDWRSDQPGHPMSDEEVTDVVAWLASQRPGKKAGGSQ